MEAVAGGSDPDISWWSRTIVSMPSDLGISQFVSRSEMPQSTVMKSLDIVIFELVNGWYF